MSDSLPEYAWKIVAENLLLSYQEDILIPSASEVFGAEFKSAQTIRNNINVQRPSLILSSLSFSKIPLQLSIDVLVGKIPTCHVYATLRNSAARVEHVFDRDADHIIIGNVWYPFVKGSLEEVRKLLASVGIDHTGAISLNNYLNLLKIHSDLLTIKFEEGASGESFSFEDEGSYVAPSALECTLYPYQETGACWLQMIANEGLGCILGDEMGLGKTLQVIALAVSEISLGRSKILVIAPATLLENWRREIEKFAPTVSTLVHRGADRTAFKDELLSVQVVITSYDTVNRDLLLFKMIEWDLAVLDEAQAIKNPAAKRSESVKQVPRRCSVAVTGTPVENRLMDLWSIMDFVLPGYLGTKSEFERKFENTSEDAEWLEPLVSPVMLRRRVSEVARDLPARIDVPQALELDPAAANSYDELRRDIFAQYGATATLVSLTKLRMYCTHPNLATESVADLASVSSKYQRLLEILEEIFQSEEKVLVFSSYSEMIDLLLDDIKNRFSGVYIDWIDGRVVVPDRQPKVDKFSNVKGPGLLVLNPRAAGTGLNITAANHVIHYNLEWNPAVEDQASARAYRRGQDKPVTVHRLFYANTVEEVINDRVERKRELVRSAIVGTAGEQDDYDDILKALTLTPPTGGI